MANDPKAEAALALHRFGLGPRAGSIAAIASDPRGALVAELDRPGAGRLDSPDLLDSAIAARAAFQFQQAPRSAPSSASPSASSGSGRTISACRLTRAAYGRFAAPTSAKPFAVTYSADSATCCSPSSR